MVSRTGTTDAIFLYNGEYGVVTDTNSLLYMRARYYSPELRRFVNADILMGDINNSATLNRYAYANGNPISNIDPFGLAADEGRGGQYTSSENSLSYLTEILGNLVSNNDDGATRKLLFKIIEMLFLKSESQNNNSIYDLIFKTPQSLIDSNYKYNSRIDIVNTFINNQNISGSAVSKLTLSGTSMADNGCEVIAVNNALNLMGYETSMAGLVRIFQENDAVVGNGLLNGYFGSNPYALGRVFDDLQINYETVSYEQLSERGLYVISFWNSTDYDSMLHTVAMQSNGKGDYITYNLEGLGKVSYEQPQSYMGPYITGYRLQPNNYILNSQKI